MGTGSDSAPRAIVVGGGFAGITAARELSLLGVDVQLLEARDRIGGRTWYDRRCGHEVELGGTWVHWFQQFVWAELARYGIGIVPSMEPRVAHYVVGGELRTGTPADLDEMLADAMDRFCADVGDVFPRPFDPMFARDAVLALDPLSVADRIASLDLEPEIAALLDTSWSGSMNAPCEEVGLLEALRWCARTAGDWRKLPEMSSTFKIEGGTRRLLRAIAGDISGEVRTSTPVASVEAGGSGVVVTTRSGEQLVADAAIVAVARNTLGAISFAPPLHGAIARAATAPQASRGVKLWARVRPVPEPFVAVAPSEYPINWASLEFDDGDSGVVLGFGSSAETLDPTDRGAVQAALRILLPGVEVDEVGAHDWVRDEFSLGTWASLRPGQYRDFADLRSPLGRVHFAGADHATGWGGFIDGAIQSGIESARELRASLDG